MKTCLLTFTLLISSAAVHASPLAPELPITVTLSADDWAVADLQDGSFAALARPDAWRGTSHRYDDDRDSFTQGSDHDSDSNRGRFDHDDHRRFDFDDFGDHDDDHHHVAAVPEPASWLLLLGGVIVLGVSWARKSRGG